MTNIEKVVTILENSLKKVASPSIAKKQSAYLKNNFEFLGITTPKRRAVQAPILTTLKPITSAELSDITYKLWQKDEREFQLAAIDLISQHHKIYSPDHLELFEYMIRNKSWWDTVDLIASKHIGKLLEKYPSLISTMDQWINDENMWIRRTALIYQLRYKSETDSVRLFKFIEKTKHEKEFFIRKAIGWALREYSKTNPEAVKGFIQQSRLSPLSTREARKYLSL